MDEAPISNGMQETQEEEKQRQVNLKKRSVCTDILVQDPGEDGIRCAKVPDDDAKGKRRE